RGGSPAPASRPDDTTGRRREAGDDSGGLPDPPDAQRGADRRRLPVLLLVPAPSRVPAAGVPVGARRADPLLAAVGVDLQLPLLSGDPVRERGRGRAAAVHPPRRQLPGPARAPDGVLPGVPGDDPRGLAARERGAEPLRAVPRAPAAVGRALEQLPEHAHLGRDPHRALPLSEPRGLGGGAAGADRAELPLHPPALPGRPAGRGLAGMGRVQGVRPRLTGCAARGRSADRPRRRPGRACRRGGASWGSRAWAGSAGFRPGRSSTLWTRCWARSAASTSGGTASPTAWGSWGSSRGSGPPAVAWDSTPPPSTS